jgi:THAP domain-containing protein 4
VDVSDPARRHIERLADLVGTWRGSGTARFPTIETAAYREELSVGWNAVEPLLHFEQRTWWKDDEPLHWESGFVIADEAGVFTMTNSQNNGRVEVLKGGLEEAHGRFELSLASTHFGNDSRMVAATRRLVLEGSTLRYTVAMTTDRVAILSPHLEATLRREP